MALPTFRDPAFDDARITALLWGDPGCGKTTLAATAPGKKAYCQFDNQGITSILYREDVKQLDFSTMSGATVISEFNTIDPFGIRAFLKDNPDVQTVIVDSFSSVADMALEYAVKYVWKNKGTSMDIPGKQGWGTRNGAAKRVIKFFQQACSEFKRHLIIITHEGAPDKDEKGVTTNVSMRISKNLSSDVGMQLNEIWYMKDTGGARMIYTRPHGVINPMKTRMFQSMPNASFAWNYNADGNGGEGIAEWYNQWKENKGNKIPLPTKK